ncbi:metallophosphoesterase [Lactiplantibacillus plantarum]|uniref:serine/threonine protein phosphatase n=1 Tax=Lactiplantibacillus plantarum TaxID=1590 RepID=UPI0034E819B1
MPLYTFIGDIHSAADDLAVLLADPEVTATRLIFLGDYIDGTAARYFGHATESAPLAPLKVLTMVRKRVWEYGDVALLGNHDEFWLRTAHGDDNATATWVLNGGHRTWRKLGIYSSNPNHVRRALNGALLKPDTDFLAHLPLMWQHGRLLAMHAGVNWQYPLTQQTTTDLLWIRDDYYDDFTTGSNRWHRNLFNKVIITGHTPVQTLTGSHTGYLKMQADAQDVPRYLIDAGSRSGLFDGGICALTLTVDGEFVRAKRVIKGHRYDGQQIVTPAMLVDQAH